MQAVFHFAAAVVIFVGSSSGSCCSCCFCSSGKYLLMCQGIILGYIPLLNRCRFSSSGEEQHQRQKRWQMRWRFEARAEAEVPRKSPESGKWRVESGGETAAVTWQCCCIMWHAVCIKNDIATRAEPHICSCVPLGAACSHWQPHGNYNPHTLTAARTLRPGLSLHWEKYSFT